jgi:hypothetical protein
VSEVIDEDKDDPQDDPGREREQPERDAVVESLIFLARNNDDIHKMAP